MNRRSSYIGNKMKSRTNYNEELRKILEEMAEEGEEFEREMRKFGLSTPETFRKTSRPTSKKRETTLRASKRQKKHVKLVPEFKLDEKAIAKDLLSNPRLFKILELIREEDAITPAEIAKRLKFAEASVRRYIKILREMQLLETIRGVDGRRKYVQLSSLAKSALEHAEKLLLRRVERRAIEYDLLDSDYLKSSLRKLESEDKEVDKVVFESKIKDLIETYGLEWLKENWIRAVVYTSYSQKAALWIKFKPKRRSYY